MSLVDQLEYKNSGNPWFGDVPSHWQHGVKLKTLSTREPASFTNGPFGSDLLTSELKEAGVPVIYIRDLNADGYRRRSTSHVTLEKARELDRFRVDGDDILIAKVGDPPGFCCLYPSTEPTAIICQDVIRLKPDTELIFPSYLCFLLNSQPGVESVNSVCVELTRKRFSLADLQSLRFPFPPIEEQKAISSFLDVKTSKIDGLVSEQRRLIELLKEKRQAVISHAVTKGLKLKAPMKPSGIQWLGDVPQHWDVLKLKRVASVRTGVAKGKDHGDKKTIRVPYLRVANVQDGYLDLNEVTEIDILEHELDRYRLEIGDVLMNEGGDFDKLGRGHIWEGQVDPCITQNHVFAVRPTSVSPRWLNQITSSDYARFYFMGQSKQSTNLASISSTNLMNLPVILPPEDEQNEILDFITDSTDAFDRLLSESERANELLQERRTALISAAVTGKIDVRQFAYQESA